RCSIRAVLVDRHSNPLEAYMKLSRTPIAAALCCMALAASPFALAEGGKSSTMRSGSSGMSDRSSGMSGSHYGASTADSQTVRQVQQALADKGHNPGPIDGIMGPRTRAALQDYQRKNDLSSASGLDQQTLDSLGVQASASGASGRMASGSSDSGSSAGSSGAPTGGAGGAGTSSVPNPSSSSSGDQGTASDGAANSRFPTPESRASGSSGSSGSTAANPSPSG